jgi:hypothetical protein
VAGTGSGGSGLTTFTGPQNYTGGFKFIGANLTVNNTLQTDTDNSGGDGNITVNAGSGTGTFTVGASGNIQPGGTGAAGGKITVTGTTTNNGIITAAVTSISVPIEFNGNYTSASGATLTGSINTAAQTIVFKGNAEFGNFTHNEDTVQFSGAMGTNHQVSQAGTNPPNLANVVIDTGNTVTVSSGRIDQDPAGTGRTLTLTGTASLNTTNGSWYIGPPTTLPSPSWRMLSNPSPLATSVDSYYVNPGPEFTGGFAGFNGGLTMGNGAKLETDNFYTQMTNAGSNEFILTAPSGASEMCHINASGHVTINETFTNPTHATLAMTGDRRELAVRSHAGSPHRVVDVRLGDFVADGGSTAANATVINSDVIFAGENAVTIKPTKSLTTYNTAYIQVNPGSGLTASKWDQTDGTFNPNNSTVEFGDKLSSNRTFTITGNTTWYNLTCEEPDAKLEFSNWNASIDCHTVKSGGKFTVKSSNPAQWITLIRPSTVSGTPGNPPASTDKNLFWHFKLEDGASFDFEYVLLEYSWAVNRIVLPLTHKNKIKANYVSSGADDPDDHYDYNWIWNLGFVYAFTEDTNHNGRIDRIRLQASVDIYFPPDWKDQFKAEVEDYEVKDYDDLSAIPLVEDDNIVVNLVEKDHSDGGVRPRVKIIQSSLLDRLQRVYTLSMVDLNGDGWMDTIDTVVPRINYTLALPEGDGVFVQLSEPVKDLSFSGTTDISAAGHFPVTEESGGVREFIVAANPQELSLANLADDNKKIKITAQDLSPAPSPVNPDVVPKYPEEQGNYFAYSADPIDAGIGHGDGKRPPYDLVASGYAPDASGYTAPPVEHRLTALLISVPPASAEDTRYFVWPLWAKNDNPAVFVGQDQFIPGTGDMNIDGSPVPERGIIWDFTGRESLQIKGSITLQMMQNGVFNAAAGRDHKLVSAQNVGNEYLAAAAHGPEGLWLPDQGPPSPPPIPFLNITPQFFTGKSIFPSSPVVLSAAPSTDRSIYNFVVPGTAYSPGMFDFYFHLDGTSSNLFVARLDTAPGLIPEDWYRRVKPFTFRLRDLTLQRGGVTILNNVIDPTRGERTFVHYHLVNSGRVTVQVFTLDGTLVQILQRGSQEAGEYDAIWDGKNRQGRPVARGMYFIRVVAPDIDEIRKVMVVK